MPKTIPQELLEARKTSYNEFVTVLLKKRGKKNFRLGNKPTVYKSYNWVRDNWLKPNGVKGVNREEFYRIISEVNKAIREEVLQGYPVAISDLIQLIPSAKDARKPRIDWEKTKKAWFEDMSLYKDGICIKERKTLRAKIEYRMGRIKNRKWLYFIPCRSFKLEIKRRYENNETTIV